MDSRVELRDSSSGCCCCCCRLDSPAITPAPALFVDSKDDTDDDDDDDDEARSDALAVEVLIPPGGAEVISGSGKSSSPTGPGVFDGLLLLSGSTVGRSLMEFSVAAWPYVQSLSRLATSDVGGGAELGGHFGFAATADASTEAGAGAGTAVGTTGVADEFAVLFTAPPEA